MFFYFYNIDILHNTSSVVLRRSFFIVNYS